MTDPGVIDRLNNVSKQLDHIKDACNVPSISVGVLHRGEIIYTYSIGVREQRHEPGEEVFKATPDTSYLLASCSKVFLACAVGILVEEGLMHWDDPISKHVPDFNPIEDPSIGRGATIRHALSHTTGLGRQNPLILGIKGNLLVTGDRTVALLNQAPTHGADNAKQSELGDEEETRNTHRGGGGDMEKGPHDLASLTRSPGNPPFIQRDWHYNNFAFGIIGLAIQNVSGFQYADFLHKRILAPLGMHCTIVSREGMDNSDNRAIAYGKLKDDTFAKINTDAMTDDSHTPLLGCLGIQSSVNDMLKMSKALLEAYHAECRPGPPIRSKENPLRQISAIWSCQAEVADDLFSYGMGCYLGKFPSQSFSSFGINYRTRWEEPEFFQRHVIGRDQTQSGQQMDFVGHVGNVNGFASSVTIFPEKQVAFVAMANGFDLGDAADWSVKLLAQAFFDTTPRVDIVELAKMEALLWKRWFADMRGEWLEARDPIRKEQPLADYIGKYEGYNTTIEIELCEETSHLSMTINGVEDSSFNLEFFGYDQYSFMSLKKDDWLLNGMWDWDYYFVGVLNFTRNSHSRKVEGFSWKYEAYEATGQFNKVDTSSGSNVQPWSWLPPLPSFLR